MQRFLLTDGYFLNAPVKDNSLGKLIGKLCYFKPYKRNRNIEVFTKNNFVLDSVINLPWYFSIATVKEGHLFKRHRG